MTMDYGYNRRMENKLPTECGNVVQKVKKRMVRVPQRMNIKGVGDGGNGEKWNE